MKLLYALPVLALMGCGDTLARVSQQIEETTGLTRAQQECIALQVATREGMERTAAAIRAELVDIGMTCAPDVTGDWVPVALSVGSSA